MPVRRYLLLLLFLLPVCPASAQVFDSGTRVSVFLGYLPRPLTYALIPDSGSLRPPSSLITLNGLPTYRISGAYLSFQYGTPHPLGQHGSSGMLIYVDFFGYAGEGNGGVPDGAYQPGVTENSFNFPQGYVLIQGYGFGYGLQQGAVSLSAGIGGYVLDLPRNVYAVNGRFHQKGDTTWGARLMGGIALGNHLSVEVGATYLQGQMPTPGLITGIRWRF